MGRTLRISDGDWYIDPNLGQSEELTGPEKTSQDLQESFMTVYDSNRNFGINLPTSIGSVPDLISEALVANEVNQTIVRLQQLQRSDPAADRYERINQVTKLEVAVAYTDVAWYVQVQTEAGDSIQKTNIERLRPVEANHQLSP